MIKNPLSRKWKERMKDLQNSLLRNANIENKAMLIE